MSFIGTFGMFTTVRMGIYTSQQGLNLTGNNIANINTVGYTRQTLDLKSMNAAGVDRYTDSNTRIGSGAYVTGISQMRDPYLDIRYRTEAASVGYMDTKLSNLNDLAAILDEVGAGDDENGIISAQFSDFLATLENLTEYTDALTNAGCKSPTIRRLAEFGAILLTVADIAEEALGLTFSRDKIIEFLVDQQVNADSNLDIGTRAHNALRGFINSNIANFITDGSGEWKKSIHCYGRVDYSVNGGMEVSIFNDDFPKILSKLHFDNPSLILKAFKAAGWLDYEDKKNYRKRKILNVDPTARVIVVKFP